MSMRALSLDGVRSVLLVGAHSDDIEIGCGGTVLRLVAANPAVTVHWIVFSGQGNRTQEAEASAARFLEKVKARTVEVHQFRDGFFPSEQALIKTYFEELKAKVDPDLIFTHYHDDMHQDHRVISELTWNTYRRHTVLEYEVPKWDGDLGNPNVYVPLGQEHARQKVQILMECFGTQRGKHWFDEETFNGLMRLRALECNAESKRAEAFYGRKVTI